MVVCGCLLFSISFSHTTYAVEDLEESFYALTDQYDEDLLLAYEQLCDFIATNNIEADISIEGFYAEYINGAYPSLDDYLRACYSIFDTSSDSSNSSSTYTLNTTNWYYNTGTRLTIPGATSYSVYISDNVSSPSFTLHTTSTTTYYIDSTLQEGKTYIFRVVAKSSGGNSSYSDSFYFSL